MKKIVISILVISFTLSLTACSNTNETENLVQENTNNEQTTNIENILDTELENIKNREKEIINKEEKTDNYTIFIYSQNNFEEYNFPVPTENKYQLLSKEINKYLELDLNVSISKNEKNLYINFDSQEILNLNNATTEIKLLESYAKTFSENLGCRIFFTIDNKDYNTENFYFGKEENYPIF